MSNGRWLHLILCALGVGLLRHLINYALASEDVLGHLSGNMIVCWSQIARLRNRRPGVALLVVHTLGEHSLLDSGA